MKHFLSAGIFAVLSFISLGAFAQNTEDKSYSGEKIFMDAHRSRTN